MINRTHKKIMCLLAMALVTAAVPTAANAADVPASVSSQVIKTTNQGNGMKFTIGGIQYKVLHDNYVAAMGFKEDNADLSVPKRVTYQGIDFEVKSIGDFSYENESSLETAEAEEAYFVGYRSFKNCTNLNKITLPDTVTCVADEAFMGCTSLTEVVIPENVDLVGKNAFDGCSNLAVVTILGDNVEIDTDAFAGTNPNFVVKNDWAKDNLLQQGIDASKIIVDDTFSVEGIKYKILHDHAISAVGFDEEVSRLEIPEHVYYNNVRYQVRSVGDYGYTGQESIGDVLMSDPVYFLGYCSFKGCTNLRAVLIPSTVTAIADYAFDGCTNLCDVDIPKNVDYIGEYAFKDCVSLNSVQVPDSVKEIKKGAFEGCTNPDLQFVVNSDETRNLLINAGVNPNQIKYEIEFVSDGVKYRVLHHSYASVIGYEDNFSDLQLVDSVSYNGVTYEVRSVGNFGFNGCLSLSAIGMKSPLNFIGYSAFGQCSNLMSVEIPDTVTCIANNAFENCTSLQSIVISSSVDFIGGEAFKNCSALTNIKIEGDHLNYLGKQAFMNCSDDLKFTVESEEVRDLLIDYGIYEGNIILENEEIVEETPVVEEVADETVEETPVVEEAADETVEETPVVEEVADETVEETQVVEEAADETVEETPVVEEAANETVEETPVVEEVVDETVEETSESEEVVEDVEE